MHPHLSLHSCQPRQATAPRLQSQRYGSRLVSRAMPFQLPNPGQLSKKLNPLQLLTGPTKPQQLQQPQQQPNHSQTHIPAEGLKYSTQVVPLGTAQQPVPITGLSLKFAKHLANVSNGCAPPMSRFESLGWLLFESKRLQASLIGSSPSAADSWLCSTDSMQLLEQIYLVGAAIAELGTADGLQPMSSSNGSRAIVSLDYSRLLERYLQQHGQLLAEEFWSQLHAYDDLQARAIHVATALETRCMVHAMLFDKLIERVGTEPSAAAAWGGGSWPAQGSVPLATAITNTMINTTQQHSAPVTTQSTVAAPSAVNSNCGNNSNIASSSATGTQPTVHGMWGWLGQLGAVFLLLCTVAGKVVQVVIAVVSFAKDVVVQLLMLRAVSAGAKAVAAKAAGQPQLQPAFAGAGALPAADAVQARQLPEAVGAHSTGVLQPAQPVAAAVAAGSAPPVAAGTAVSAAAPTAAGTISATLLPTATQQLPAQPPQPQQHQQQEKAHGQQLQGQQQNHVRTPGACESALQPAAVDGLQQASAQQVQQPQVQAVASSTAGAQGSLPSQGKSMRSGLRAGLRGGLGATQQQLPQQKGAKPFKAGSGNLLYSLWSPAEAGLQDMDLQAAAGVQFADAGWGVTGSSAGAAVHSVEEGW